MNLLSIRKSFTPYIPIRWAVQFNNPDLNIIDNKFFPAIEVFFPQYSINTHSVQVAPGFSIEVTTNAYPPTLVEISFYETIDKDVINTLLEIIASLKTGNGGFNTAVNNLKMSIIEYDTQLDIVEVSSYYVQLKSTYTQLLQQQAQPFSEKLSFIIVGEA